MAIRKINHKWERVKGTYQKPKYKVRNFDFAEKSELFRKACELASVEPTERMASKWRNKKGSAYMYIGSAYMYINLAKTKLSEEKGK